MAQNVESFNEGFFQDFRSSTSCLHSLVYPLLFKEKKDNLQVSRFVPRQIFFLSLLAGLRPVSQRSR